jgi:hypothetical protein
MLYVQFDAAVTPVAEREPPEGAIAVLRARRLGDVLDGLELRAGEPTIAFFRFATLLFLGVDALRVDTWARQGLDVTRGFALALGAREPDRRWPLGLAAWATRPEALGAWLADRGIGCTRGGDILRTGNGAAAMAAAALGAPWQGSLASDDPYLEAVVRLGSAHALWAAATRRGPRFQVEMVVRLPGLPPVHVIARDPPLSADEVIPPEAVPPVRIGGRPAPSESGPPRWDEPGPCDCGIPPDLCAMKRFRLTPPSGGPLSQLPGADAFRQLTASLVDLHAVRRSDLPGAYPGDRVLVARSPESIAALSPDDAVLDDSNRVCRRADADRPLLGAILQAVPWPPLGRPDSFRSTFSGIG